MKTMKIAASMTLAAAVAFAVASPALAAPASVPSGRPSAVADGNLIHEVGGAAVRPAEFIRFQVKQIIGPQ
ncbi:hypothetical protein [Streptomyces katrae]|uniref:hypothetical protein n=1 Tax=Streptomyces katrae TaxID=68223 RepID=UPI0004C0308B|nr:hypothetical protein [Streptomyces katrae]